jgi:hypothetical protein
VIVVLVLRSDNSPNNDGLYNSLAFSSLFRIWSVGAIDDSEVVVVDVNVTTDPVSVHVGTEGVDKDIVVVAEKFRVDGNGCNNDTI